VVIDELEPVFNESSFKVCYWSEFYLEVAETIPIDVPIECGNVYSCFVNSDHAGCRVMGHLQMGVIMFVNRVPIQWYLKHQNTVETSTFGKEVCAMKMMVNMIDGLCISYG
jgi:hypothetical protein